MKETIEEKVSNAILEKTNEVVIGGVKYNITPPSTGTLIMASGFISKLPEFDTKTKSIAEMSLAVASDCAPLGNVLAVLILGAKKAKEVPKERKGILFFGKKKIEETEFEILSKKILDELTPSQLHEMVIEILKRMEIADFFQVTASLTEINLLRPTRAAVMTQSGLQSQE